MLHVHEYIYCIQRDRPFHREAADTRYSHFTEGLGYRPDEQHAYSLEPVGTRIADDIGGYYTKRQRMRFTSRFMLHARLLTHPQCVITLGYPKMRITCTSDYNTHVATTLRQM